MNKILLLLLLFVAKISIAQRVVFDRAHFNIINENSMIRNTAELTHNQYLNKINTSLDDINVNVGSVVIAQNLIYSGLANVNSALKNGLAVKDMAYIIADIIKYSAQMVKMAKNEPYLLLFAEEMARTTKGRAITLVNEVSGFVLKEGSNILMDYNSRDLLVRHITQELQLLSGLTYGAWKAMYWAKVNGVFKFLNPFASFVNQDKSIVNDIIRKSKYLNQ